MRWRGSWYLRGIESFFFVRAPGQPYAFADLNDDSVRDWLRERIGPGPVGDRIETESASASSSIIFPDQGLLT